MSFSKLKRNRDQISKLRDAAQKDTGAKKNYGDDRFWKPTVDKSGNGHAVIRFLPGLPSNNDVPWVKYYTHGFQGPTGQWYIEKSLTSIDKPDPVSEYNSELWNQGDEDSKNVARRQKRRLHYVANIYVVSDPGEPENEGKVFLYQFGKKIFDKIMDSMEPEFEDEEALNPFDLWEGANFKLRIRNVENFRNYDKSEFAKPSALSDDDEELEKIYNQMYDLREFIDPDNYKSYEELKAKMERVLQLNSSSSASTKKESADLEDEEPPKRTKEEEPRAQREEKAPVETESEDDDDQLGYFERLANEDD